MRPLDRLRRLWRELLLVALVALPWLSLVALGGLWLWQGGHVWVWAIATAALGLLAIPLWRAVKRQVDADARAALGPLAEPSPEWSLAEREAWNDVLAIADATPPFSDTRSITSTAVATIEAVARRFHPDDPAAWAHFTLPELLLLTERLSRDLRRELIRHVPGIRAVKLSHGVWVYTQTTRYGPIVQTGWRVGSGLWRLVRAALNPLQAIGQEAGSLVLNKTWQVLSLRTRAYFTRLFVIEIGRAAIDLYSGRLALSEEELRTARERDLAEADASPAAPVRILLAGQVNAGKSSLVNALADEVRCAVGPLPTTTAVKEYLLEGNGRPAAVIVDMPGLSDAADPATDVLRQGMRADLILWVASAVQPARAPDRAGLDRVRTWANAQRLRRAPPVILALTHVDRLHPVAEWDPPYDVAAPTGAKARAIRAAIDSVARSLDLAPQAVVPVAMPPGRPAYNIDALWARMAQEIDEAKLVQLDRLRVGSSAFSLREALAQLGNTGRVILKGVIDPAGRGS